jgi:hypothetical protein
MGFASLYPSYALMNFEKPSQKLGRKFIGRRASASTRGIRFPRGALEF